MKKDFFIKGFDKNLQCLGFQFEIGKEYKIDNDGGKLELCTDTVFHFCRSLRQVHQFYSCSHDNRYCEIEVLGELIEDDEKCGSNHIRIVREIVGKELDELTMRINGNTGVFNSGDHNSGDHNSGNYNSGYRNSGYRNSGNYNSGYYNSGDHNSGDRNSGYSNLGDRNSGDHNSGYRNSGNYNSGYYNSGHSNSGDCNSGNYNSGNYNSGHSNSGYFNSTLNSNGVFCNEEPCIKIFNIETNMTLSDFEKSKYYHALMSSEFNLTITDTDNKTVVRSYAEACADWWSNMSSDNKAIIKSMPNFNVDIFCDITGIDKKEVIDEKT